MDKEERDLMIALGARPVDDLKKYMQEVNPTTKVKMIGFKTTNQTGMRDLEERLNEFITSDECRKVLDIQFNVNKNFLPHTGLGEYEEVWYAMIRYE